MFVPRDMSERSLSECILSENSVSHLLASRESVFAFSGGMSFDGSLKGHSMKSTREHSSRQRGF